MTKAVKSPLSRSKKPRTQQLFSNLTIVWTRSSTNGNLRRNTSGFTAEAQDLSGNRLGRARFDAFGTAVFQGIPTPTNQTIRVRILDPNGVQVRNFRNINQRSSGFAFIG